MIEIFNSIYSGILTNSIRYLAISKKIINAVSFLRRNEDDSDDDPPTEIIDYEHRWKDSWEISQPLLDMKPLWRQNFIPQPYSKFTDLEVNL